MIRLFIGSYPRVYTKKKVQKKSIFFLYISKVGVYLSSETLKHHTMKTETNYKVQKIGGMFFVIYEFCDKETMIMSKPYRTETNAKKQLHKVRYLAGDLR